MSIIVTVHIAEGIIMAADSRLTGVTNYPDGSVDRHSLSDNSQKLFLIKNNNVGIACCGDATIDNKSVGDFIREFEINEVCHNDTIIDIAYKLRNYTISRHDNGVIYHVSGFKDDIQYVYRIIDESIDRVNEDNEILIRIVIR